MDTEPDAHNGQEDEQMSLLFSRVKDEFPDIFDRKRYTPPVLHLETLEGNDFFIAWQCVEAFEVAGVPFVALIKTREHEIEVYVVGDIDDAEVEQIVDEARSIGDLSDCDFFVTYSVL